MYVSIGSRSNGSDNAAEENHAHIFEFNPDGSGQKVYAWGIRNAVGTAFRPGTNELWMSTNERDDKATLPDTADVVGRQIFVDLEYKGDIFAPLHGS